MRSDARMTPVLSNESELYVAPGGPRLPPVAAHLPSGQGCPTVVRRIVVLFLITWVPMCLFAIVQGFALADTPGNHSCWTSPPMRVSS